MLKNIYITGFRKSTGTDIAGFTLMEILIVVSIIAILATLATVNWRMIQDRSRIDATYGEMKNMVTAETWAHNDTGMFWGFRDLSSPNLPQKDVYANFMWGGLTLVQRGITIDSTQWHGPYLSLQAVAKKMFGYGTDTSILDAFGNRHGMTDWEILPSFIIGDPVDNWGNPYRIVLLRADTTENFMVNTTGIFAVNPTDSPATAMIISNGPNAWPEYVIEPVTGSFRYRQLTEAELNSRPFNKRQRDDIYILF